MKPYIVCHMIQSIDGRIDCAMTEKIDDTDHYYETLDKLGCPNSIEGKVTLQMHYAEEGEFYPKLPYSAAGAQVYRAEDTENETGFAIGVDTKGTLLWGDNVKDQFEKPLIMLLSESASQEYLDYLKDKDISFITVGKNAIDLKAAVEILNREFGVKRLVVTGGGHLNGSFLKEGLLDEISMMYASGVDAREGRAASFDGLQDDAEPIRLDLLSVDKLDDIIWARYSVRK